MSYLNPLPHWTTSDRLYKPPRPQIKYQEIEVKFMENEAECMVDLSMNTIQTLFEQQIRALTHRTLTAKEDSFDFQLSGGWLR